MKIAVIGPTYPHKGGISHFTTLLVKSLLKKHPTSLFSWKRQYPPFLYPVTPQDSSARPLTGVPAQFPLDILNPVTWLKTAYLISRGKYDLLILTWVTPVQAPVYTFIAALVKALGRTRIMYLCHNVVPHEPHWFDPLLTRIAWRQADSFTVHSHADYHQLAALNHHRKIIVAFHPPYDFFLQNQSEPGDALPDLKRRLGLRGKVILFFGYVRPYKGLKVLIKALPVVLKGQPDTSLLVAGEFWSGDKPDYLQLIDQLKLADAVVLVDRYIPNEEVSRYFRLADVVVIPYLSASQSGVIQIALSFGKPVVSTSVGGLAEVIREGMGGVLVPPGNAPALAQAVTQVLSAGLEDSLHTHPASPGWDRYVELITKGKL